MLAYVLVAVNCLWRFLLLSLDHSVDCELKTVLTKTEFLSLSLM